MDAGPHCPGGFFQGQSLEVWSKGFRVKKGIVVVKSANPETQGLSLEPHDIDIAPDDILVTKQKEVQK